ncbi:hypothetical protein M408DRAFT_326807 [Serendipita vermifera MAFF 305830]|uniref:UFSP1/2/DUB catalytic domain-containing protein n=1 Tax=Serendipita vermifera MAFF 305830 TaxID=933852 RepID=A0A0C3B5P9_SERVB|nr:hypothetical protein M408DRAFT_326807 [Serendipita vermifera MAFF 305830]
MPRLGSLYEDTQAACLSPMKCAICDETIENLSESGRQAHYDVHFSESPRPKTSTPASSMPSGFASSSSYTSEIASTSTKPYNSTASTSTKPSLFQIPKTTTPFWTVSYASQRAPPTNYTPNFIPILRRALTKSHAKGTTTRASLCSEGVCHIATEAWDTIYGCGYRNYMMACTALCEQQVIPQYSALLKNEGDSGPGIRAVQELIERAWSEGYDGIGASQLKHKLVGTMKWIGTGELYTAFAYRGIPTRLIDFPQLGTNPEALTRWVSNYFFPPTPTAGNINSTLNGAVPIIQTNKMPLILQHQGHSRTIVGIEINRTGAPNLLVYDPAKRMPAAVRKQCLLSLPIPARSKAIPTYETSASSSDTHKGSKLAFDKQFLNKRQRFADDDEDEERDTKRSRNDGMNGKSSLNSGVEMDHMSVLKIVRVNMSNLKKKDKYQILEFTLDPPLSEEEKASRKVVRSERVL